MKSDELVKQSLFFIEREREREREREKFEWKTMLSVAKGFGKEID
jgi:DNA-binding XRE family transcriptional regulator